MAKLIELTPMSGTGPQKIGPNRIILPYRKHPATPRADIGAMFLRAVELGERVQAIVPFETNPAYKRAIGEAITAYQEILEITEHGPACINLGTIYYHQRNFHEAEKLYRQATNADPDYALAWFDLGNTLDELQRSDEAVDAYKTAVKIVPDYADAHYNLALCYERCGDTRKALPHWKTYEKLDPTGPWADHARGQINIIHALSGLQIVGKKPIKNKTPELSSHLEQVPALASEPKNNVLEMPLKRKAAQTSLFLKRKRKQKRQNRITTHEGQYKLLFPKPPSP